MASVGIRKLQQHASEVVERARNGELIEITDRGRPVAQIGPLKRTRIEALVEAGVLSRRPEAVTDLRAIEPIKADRTIRELLDEERAERV